jgi:hypothetical protein
MSVMSEVAPAGEAWVIVVAEETMKHRGFLRHGRGSWQGLIAVALFSGPLLASACSKEATPSAEPQNGVARPGVETSAAAVPPRSDPQAEPATPVTTAAPETAEALAASSRVSESNFDLAIQPKGDYKAGQPGSVEVVLDAKGPFKVNDKYPYKFKVKETAGLKYSGPVIKDGVKLEKTRAVLPVPFTPESAGKKQIAGRFDFSVCTPERCLIEKRELTLAIDVK